MKERFLIYLILALNIITLFLLLSKKSVKKEDYCGCENSCNQLDKAYLSDYNPETTVEIGGIYYSKTA